MASKDMLPIAMRNGKKESTLGKRLLTVGGCFLAGSVVSTETFAHSTGMGWGTLGLHNPFSIFNWFREYCQHPEAMPYFKMSIAAGLGTTTLSMLPFLYKGKDLKTGSTLHGSARWANKKDIEEAGFLGKKGIYIGGWEDERGNRYYLRHNGSEHVLIVAPTRSGKGICHVVTTLTDDTKSCVITDLKGELWALTAGWRKKYAGQKVLRFEPASSSGSVSWNPMDEIRIGTDYEIGDAQNLATMIVDPDGKGLEDHWQKTSQALLVGCILYLLYLRRDADEMKAQPSDRAKDKGQNYESVDASLPGVDALLADPTIAPKDLWKKMIEYQYSRKVISPLIQNTGQALMQDSKKRKELASLIQLLKEYRKANPNEELIESYRQKNSSIAKINSASMTPMIERFLPNNPELRDLLTAFVMFILYMNTQNSYTGLSFSSLMNVLAPVALVKEETETQEQADEAVRQKLWKQMSEYEVIVKEVHPTISKSGKDMLDRPEQEAGSVLSTAKSYLALFRDPVVAENVRSSGFRIHDLMNCKTPVSLYIVTQPIDKERLRPLTRILVTMICRVLAAKMTFETTDGGARRGKSTNRHKMMMMLDEFPSLGRLKIIEESIAFLAGYDISLVIIVQDMAQLLSAYGKDESISSNCHVLVAHQPLKVETAEFLSKRTGITTVVNKKASYSRKSFGLFDNNITDSIDEIQRPLATADEIMNMPGPVKEGNKVIAGGDMLVFRSGMPAIYGKQMPYFLDEAFNARVSVDPPEGSDVITDEDRIKDEKK